MALPFLSARRPPLLGVDISTTAVKLVELSRKGERYRVEAYAIEPLPNDTVQDDVIREVELVGEAIKRAVKRAGTRNKLAVVALPASFVITKVIPMPSNFSEDEMEGQIQLEADQYIPYPLEEVSLDFQVLGSSEKSDEMVDVLLAAARSENVEMRVASLDAAGLSAKVVDIETYAVENALSRRVAAMPDGGAGRLVALVDIGAAKTGLQVMRDGATLYTREEPFGGNVLIQEIMARYGLSFEEAARARRQGELPDDFRSELLGPFKDRLASTVYSALQTFYSNTEFNQVDQLLLSGGCATIDGIADHVASRTGLVGVQVFDPLEGMTPPAKVKEEQLRADAPSLVIACGLAMRSFD
ncbi:pilus assembly protein PilM [Endothiovibrio diazotrophicus]